MPLEKAKRILQAYKDKEFVATDALKSVGYSRETAETQQARTIDTAVNRLVQAGDQNEILEYLGLKSTDISKEYVKIIQQDKNYPAKLRALEPLLKAKGIQWDDTKQITTVPVLNVTVKENNMAQPSHNDKHVAQSVLSDATIVPIEDQNNEKK